MMIRAFLTFLVLLAAPAQAQVDIRQVTSPGGITQGAESASLRSSCSSPSWLSENPAGRPEPTNSVVSRIERLGARSVSQGKPPLMG